MANGGRIPYSRNLFLPLSGYALGPQFLANQAVAPEVDLPGRTQHLSHANTQLVLLRPPAFRADSSSLPPRFKPMHYLSVDCPQRM